MCPFAHGEHEIIAYQQQHHPPGFRAAGHLVGPSGQYGGHGNQARGKGKGGKGVSKDMEAAPGAASGYVFMCNDETEPECLDRMLLGDHDKSLQKLQRGIGPDTLLFLFNFDSKCLLGTFKADGEPQKNIIPEA